MSAVLNYQAALRQFQAARSQVGFLVSTIQAVSCAFEKWEAVDPGALNGSLDRALQNWFFPEDAQKVIGTWKHAWIRVLAAWDAIPDADRIGLIEPRQMKWETQTP